MMFNRDSTIFWLDNIWQCRVPIVEAGLIPANQFQGLRR